MTKEDAIKRAEGLGYTIQYESDDGEIRLRKPNGAVNSLNQPYEYCIVFEINEEWDFEEKLEPLIM
jgi:hypothetical protein